ncbi:MAG: dihydrodipicolinate synthase family protein [Hyphomicrobiaceae bacterium]
MKYGRHDAKEYARENLRGLWAANLTPFSSSLEFDEPGFRKNLRHWIDDLELDGLFICGKQAEYFSMSLTERKRQIEITVEEADGHCGTMISCSDENIETVLDLARHAQHLGADYIIVHSPPLYFHKSFDEVLFRYYEFISSQVDIAVAMWHQPDYNYVMSPQLCAKIADLPNIVAIKYSVDRALYSELTRIAGEKLIVSTSSEDHWLDNIEELGWQVYLCSTPPYLMQTKVDRRIKKYTELAFAGEYSKARVIRDSLDPVREALRTTRPQDKPQAHQKYWQELVGQVGGPVRRPLLNLTDAERARTREAFESCGLGVDRLHSDGNLE